MPPCVHTLTVDVSHDDLDGWTGIGVVIQTRAAGSPSFRRGPIVEEIKELHHDLRARDCERISILRALEIAIARGFSHVKIRANYNWLRRRIPDALRGDTKGGLEELDRQIVSLADRFEVIEFRCIPRRKKQIAHRLANVARKGESAGKGRKRKEEPEPMALWEIAIELEIMKYENEEY